jgi:amino acid adenylation domain-containing protein/thioester reductase-like protein
MNAVAIEGFRLSFQQSRLWLLQQDGSVYNSQVALFLHRHISTHEMQSHIKRLVRRHQSLRTSFQSLPGLRQPLQTIRDDDSFEWEEQDLTGVEPAERETQIMWRVERLRHRRFDLECGPLLHSALLRRADTADLLILTMPSLCGDLRALEILVVNLDRLLFQAEDSDLVEEPVQYLQFSEWQRDLFEEFSAAGGESYWRENDLVAASSLALPFEARSNRETLFQPASASIELAPEEIRYIDTLTGAAGASTESILMALFAMVISRLNDNRTIVVGDGCDGRYFAEIQQTVGLFATYLPLRCRLDASLTVKDLISAIQELRSEGGQYQHYFRSDRFSQTSIGAQAVPIFSLCFDSTRPFDAIKLSGLVALHGYYSCSDRFKLRVSVSREADSLRLSFSYDPHLFAGRDIRRLADCLRAALARAAEKPDTRFCDFSVLSEGEFNQVVYEFNDSVSFDCPDVCIHDVIETEARRKPDGIAVTNGDRSLTYGELNLRSNRLANFLCNLGIGPERPVALCIDRSLEMTVGILGILKAGGAYVPLNPDLASERRSFIIRNAGASILLTKSLIAGGFEGESIRLVLLDADWDLIARESCSSLPTRAEPDHLAYVIYTSGSTGEPKGVMVTHRNLVNSTCSRFAYYRLPVVNFMLVSPFYFDSSVVGIFWTLCQGGTLTLAAEDFQRDLSLFIASAAQSRVTHILCIPSLCHAILEHPESSCLDSLEVVIVAGEACPARVVERQRVLLGGATLFNEYGPTECTVWCSVHEFAPDSSETHKPSIGKPIPNSRIYILDPDLNPMPMGCSGELHIGGSNVARGYAGLAALTAEKFVPDPFGRLPGSRLYRTGDVGRHLSSGDIDLLGRIDNQVKIRGFRVELEEIEAVLKRHRSVKDAVVVLDRAARESLHARDEEDARHDRLIAYVLLDLPRSDTTTSLPDELRGFLAEHLPAPVIPAILAPMSAFPMTPNGKVDRRALPPPNRLREQAYIEPQNELEESLSRIWLEILGVERLGTTDDFFEMGGDSIKALFMINRIHEQLGRRIDVPSLLQSPTIRELAVALTASRPSEALDLRAEAVLDSEIYPETTWRRKEFEMKSIFLTGATGFLGVFLLAALLRQTRADIFCLVRSDDVENGARRIKHALESYGLWDHAHESRIVPVLGDLSRPLLGISLDQFRLLASKIDVIYHNGALVNFVYPYLQLKPANVLGTQEVFRLATRVRVKPVHYVSTITIFSSIGERAVIFEEDQPEPPVERPDVPMGYAQSKWVAEQLAIAAQSRGVPVSIYRAGRITGDSRTGASSLDDFSCRFIKGCIELGAVPDWDGETNIITVDYASDAIVRLSLQQESSGKTFHLLNPAPVTWESIVDWIKSYGFAIRKVGYREWREGLRHSPGNALYPLLPTFPLEGLEEERLVSEISSKRRIEFDCRNTLNGLAQTGVTSPSINSELIHSYLSYFVKKGFLAKE